GRRQAVGHRRHALGQGVARPVPGAARQLRPDIAEKGIVVVSVLRQALQADAEDDALDFPVSARIVDKPWGNELIWALTDRYAGKILHIKKGHSLSLQYHNRKDETIMVLSGKMEFIHYREGQT